MWPLPQALYDAMWALQDCRSSMPRCWAWGRTAMWPRCSPTAPRLRPQTAGCSRWRTHPSARQSASPCLCQSSTGELSGRAALQAAIPELLCIDERKSQPEGCAALQAAVHPMSCSGKLRGDLSQEAYACLPYGLATWVFVSNSLSSYSLQGRLAFAMVSPMDKSSV